VSPLLASAGRVKRERERVGWRRRREFEREKRVRVWVFLESPKFLQRRKKFLLSDSHVRGGHLAKRPLTT